MEPIGRRGWPGRCGTAGVCTQVSRPSHASPSSDVRGGGRLHQRRIPSEGPHLNTPRPLSRKKGRLIHALNLPRGTAGPTWCWVEGNIDVITPYWSGRVHVVGCPWALLTEEHARSCPATPSELVLKSCHT